MTLREWLDKNDKTATAFAVELDVAPSTITRILNEQMYPNYSLLEKIHKVTKGKVTLGDFRAESA